MTKVLTANYKMFVVGTLVLGLIALLVLRLNQLLFVLNL